MEVLVVTGLGRNAGAMQRMPYKLYEEGFRMLSNPAANDAHPRDITDAVRRDILVMGKFKPNGRFFYKTNSDHAINALRVLRFEGKVDVLKIKHFGPDGKEYDIEVGADGEPSSYPDGFLDEWPRMMGGLAPKTNGKEDN